MSYDGNGTYNPPQPQYPAIPNTTIYAEDFNTIVADIAAALSLVLVRDGQSPMTGDLNMGNNDIINLASIAASVAGLVISGTVTFQGGVSLLSTLNVAGLTTLASAKGVTMPNGTNTADLATCAFVLQTAMQAALPSQPGGTARYDINSVGGIASWALYGSMSRRQISAASTITKDDSGGLVEITANSFTLAFDPVATLGDRASGLIQNSSTTSKVTLDPSGAELIDGLASYVMYPGEIRRWYVAGGAVRTMVLKRFYMSETVAGNFIKPPGYTAIDLDGVGASGGAGSGCRSAAGNPRSGGGPGGAPARVRRRVYGLADGSSTAYTVGGAGTGGAAVLTDNTNGNNGTAGGNTTFGTLLTAFGGVAGRGGDTSTNAPATSGSGSISAGTAIIGGNANGGLPATPGIMGAGTAGALNNYDEGGGGVGNPATNSPGGCTIWGGAGSANPNLGGLGITSGGSSINGVPAGGTGGYLTTSNTFPANAGTAGARGSYTAGGGAAGGACGAAPTAGTNGPNAASDDEVGGAGSGGGSSTTAAAGAGGDGGFPGGSPGGGGASQNGFNSGKGGDGKGGRIIILGVV